MSDGCSGTTENQLGLLLSWLPRLLHFFFFFCFRVFLCIFPFSRCLPTHFAQAPRIGFQPRSALALQKWKRPGTAWEELPQQGGRAAQAAPPAPAQPEGTERAPAQGGFASLQPARDQPRQPQWADGGQGGLNLEEQGCKTLLARGGRKPRSPRWTTSSTHPGASLPLCFLSSLPWV